MSASRTSSIALVDPPPPPLLEPPLLDPPLLEPPPLELAPGSDGAVPCASAAGAATNTLTAAALDRCPAASRTAYVNSSAPEYPLSGA
jgi:hypothetical protein